MMKKYLFITSLFCISLQTDLQSADAASFDDDALVEQLEEHLSETQTNNGENSAALDALFDNVKIQDHENKKDLETLLLDPLNRYLSSIPALGGLSNDEVTKYRNIIFYLSSAAHGYGNGSKPEHRELIEKIQLATSSLYNKSSGPLKNFWHEAKKVSLSPIIIEIIGEQEKQQESLLSSIGTTVSTWWQSMMPTPLEGYQVSLEEEQKLKDYFETYGKPFEKKD